MPRGYPVCTFIHATYSKPLHLKTDAVFHLTCMSSYKRPQTVVSCLYKGGNGFESWPVNQLSLLGIVAVFLRSSSDTPGRLLN